ncbi:hypothetical protein [uncultured Methanobrevibacter sp.]|uniref:hypothetical protein n=1 Tax=uncultured Methanobrevibacter sp. TaxID=253161 RepID=UPI0025EDCD3C|nr:hypothetical protein [uncultured Methanobrevibacter sp.]
MVNTAEEIMLTLEGRDNASQMFANVDKNAQSMASNISAAMSKVNMGLMNIGQVSDNVMQSLTGKSALDNIFGTTSKAETNAVLLKNMLDDTAKNYDKFYEKVDKTTDSSLTSMQELIPALKAFKSATGATDKEMTNITDEMANFGAAVLAQTGSTDLAQQSMMDLSKGIKGAFAALDQYGITQDALERTGYWNGDEKDVEGFMKAVQKVTGSTEELMETNTGLDALIGKAFSRAGKKIGNEFLPIIKDVKRGFIDLDNELGGNLTASMLVLGGGIDTLNQGFWNISTTANGLRDIGDGFEWLTKKIKGTTDAAEAAGDAINTISNISDMGAGAAGLGGAVGAGAQAGKKAGKAEKAVEGGLGAMSTADMLANLKSKNNYSEEAIKEASKSVKSSKQIQKEIDTAYDAEAKIFELMGKKDAAQANIDSGIFGSGMRKQFQKQIQDVTDEMDNIVGRDLWNGIKSNKSSLSKVEDESNSLWKYYQNIFDGQETAMSNAEKVSSKLGFKDKGGIGVFRELAEETSSSRQEASKVLTGLDELKDVQDEIQWGMDYTQSGFLGKLKMRKDKGVKGNVSDLLGGIKNFFKGGEEIADVVDDASDIGKTLSGVDDIADGMSAAAAAGEAATAAGPAMEAGAAGGTAAAAGATSLSAAFTSMIVPLLALSAVIIVMIPIVALIAAEAMVFLRLLADFMQALNFDNVDLKGATKGIQQVATALAWVGVAMAAMSFTSIMTGLAVITGGFMGILGPLDIAVNALKQAGQKLSQFNSVAIDPSVATKIKTISETLGSVAEAMGSLTWNNIVTGFSNFVANLLGFSSVTDGLEQAKNDIIKASEKLNEFSGITALDEGVAQNIQNVCNSLASVGDAMGALRSIRDGQNWDDIFGSLMNGLFGEGVDIQTALMNVKDDIIQASQALAQFEGISEIPEDISGKIQKVGSTLTTVNDTVNTIKEMVGSGFDNWVEGLFGGYDVAGGLEKIKTDLITASQKLAELSALSEIDEGITEKITQVGAALQKVSEVSTTLTTIGDSGIGEFDSSIITTAVNNVQTAATELARLNEVTFDGATADTMLGAIQTTLENLKTTLAAASGFTEASMSIGTQIITGVQSGLAPLPGAVQTSVSSAINSAGSQALAGGAMLGRATTTGMKSTLQLASVMSAEMDHVKAAVDNGIAAAKSAAEGGAKEVVEAFKSGINVGSPGDIARTMKQEMLYTKQFIQAAYEPLARASYEVAKGIVGGFGNPSLDMDMGMFSNGGQLTAEHIGALKTTISNAPEKQDNRPVTIIVQEGAVRIDARNHTVKDAQRLMITAFEGMNHITNIDVDI